jgi:biotin carboxyl carrier protein
MPADRTTPGSDSTVRAPLRGTLVRVDVEDGDEVAAGQRLAVVEAMKMENEVTAPTAGRVIDVLRADRTIAEGDVICRIVSMFDGLAS